MKKIVIAFVLTLAGIAAAGSFSTSTLNGSDPLPSCPPVCNPPAGN